MFNSPSSHGYRIYIPVHSERRDCADGRDTVLLVRDQESIQIDGHPVVTSAFPSRLAEIYRPLSERVLFLKANPEVNVQDLASVIDRAHRTVPNLHIAIVTPEIEKEPCWIILVPPKPLPLPEG